MKKYMNIAIACLVGMAMTACKDHVPGEEPLPTRAIDFSYEVVGEKYLLDYYVGSTIMLYPTVDIKTPVEWDFGDGTTETSNIESGGIVMHKYTAAGHYKITAKANGGTKTCVLYIADIIPIVTQVNDPATTGEGLVEVSSSYVNFNVELPNPDSLKAIFQWSFPAGTTDENDQPVENFVQHFDFVGTEFTPDVALGKVKFAKVGSQSVKLQVQLETNKGTDEFRNLDMVTKNVQVALNEAAPTLYYVVKDGTINAIKLPASRTIDGVIIEPYDMGVSSGQHMLNICYDNETLYLLDCGKQFVYVNDIDGVLGDGKVQAMSVDASTVGVVITNVGGTAFKDPYFGFIEEDKLYFSDRNTGFRPVNTSTRNAIYSADAYPSYVENNWIGYYGTTSMVYGCMNACFGRDSKAEPWYWCKRGIGSGVFRFMDSDNNGSGRSDWKIEEQPASGQLFEGFCCSSYVHDIKNKVYYFEFHEGRKGFFRIPEDQLNTFHPKVSDDDVNLFNSFEIKYNGNSLQSITTNGMGEGNTDEFIGICQMALDENTGDVYFGFRSADETMVPSGLMRYNAETGEVEHVIQGVKVFGVAVCPIQSKLFK